MNQDKENIMDSLNDVQPVTPVDRPNTNINPSITEENANMSFTEILDHSTKTVNPFYTNEPVIPVTPQPFETEQPVDTIPSTETIQTVPTLEEENPVEVSIDPMSSGSYTEIPVASVTEVKEKEEVTPVLTENPNAKVSLRPTKEKALPEIPETNEKMDKGTIWMLVWLFLGLLAVIIALPYLFQLF